MIGDECLHHLLISNGFDTFRFCIGSLSQQILADRFIQVKGSRFRFAATFQKTRFWLSKLIKNTARCVLRQLQ